MANNMFDSVEPASLSPAWRLNMSVQAMLVTPNMYSNEIRLIL